jgi:hypothetical protein
VAHVFCEHGSPIAYDLKSKAPAEQREVLFHVWSNDLANYTSIWMSLILKPLASYIIWRTTAPRRPISSGPASFRLQALKTGSVLFAPTIPESQAINAPVALMIDGGSNLPSLPTACTAEKGPFRLSSTSLARLT